MFNFLSMNKKLNIRNITIVLNIGLDLKVISPKLFTMMVRMALVTTFMTGPILEWLLQKKPELRDCTV